MNMNKSMLTDDYDFLLIQTWHPEIAKKINWVWGSDIFHKYVSILLTDTRDGTRQGFNKDVISSLIALQQKHDEEFPLLVPKNTDIWASQ